MSILNRNSNQRHAGYNKKKKKELLSLSSKMCKEVCFIRSTRQCTHDTICLSVSTRFLLSNQIKKYFFLYHQWLIFIFFPSFFSYFRRITAGDVLNIILLFLVSLFMSFYRLIQIIDSFTLN